MCTDLGCVGKCFPCSAASVDSLPVLVCEALTAGICHHRAALGGPVTPARAPVAAEATRSASESNGPSTEAAVDYDPYKSRKVGLHAVS